MFPSFPVFSVVSQPFKRSQLGLFQGKTKQYGNNVPFSKHKTRRTWLPNVQRKRLFSGTLGETVRVKVTTRALKTIKKVSFLLQVFCWRSPDISNQHGGLDNYVSKTRADILGWEGMRIRLMVREHAERKAMGQIGGNKVADGETTADPTIDAKAKKREKRIALRELTALRWSKPTLDSAREDRLKAMAALNLDSLPRYVFFPFWEAFSAYPGASAKQTIRFLKDRRQSLLQLAGQ